MDVPHMPGTDRPMTDYNDAALDLHRAYSAREIHKLNQQAEVQSLDPSDRERYARLISVEAAVGMEIRRRENFDPTSERSHTPDPLGTDLVRALTSGDEARVLKVMSDRDLGQEQLFALMELGSLLLVSAGKAYQDAVREEMRREEAQQTRHFQDVTLFGSVPGFDRERVLERLRAKERQYHDDLKPESCGEDPDLTALKARIWSDSREDVGEQDGGM